MTYFDRFMKKYSSMSDDERREVMYYKNEPCTWNVFYIEIWNKTMMGKIMLNQLIKEKKI